MCATEDPIQIVGFHLIASSRNTTENVLPRTHPSVESRSEYINIYNNII